MEPGIFADRFIVGATGEAFDLATGEPVRLRLVSPTGRAETDRWLTRCAALSGFRHPHLVPLVDFGAVGRDRFFEAWACPHTPDRWPSRDAEAARAVGSAVRFLAARSLTAGRFTWGRVVNLAGAPALLPGPDAGLPARSDAASVRDGGSAEHAAADDLAVEVLDDLVMAAISRLADVLDAGRSGRPRCVRLDARQYGQRRLLTWALARTARLRGFVPVGAATLDDGRAHAAGTSGWRTAVDGRHVLLLQADPGNSGSIDVPLFFVALGLSSDRPHVLLQLDTPSRPAGGPTPASVRESASEYVTDPRASVVWTAIESGRHAQAERVLRDAFGSYARRHDDEGAGESALALGRLLLVRGQPAEALRMIEYAREHFHQARAAGGALCAAVFAGLASTDDGRLRDAEAALRAARIAAAELAHDDLDQFARVALARCLYWQDRLAEAWECLGTDVDRWDDRAERPPGHQATQWTVACAATVARERLRGVRAAVSTLEWTPGWGAPGAVGLDVARRCLASRIALAAGDVARAGRLAALAYEAATRSANPTERAAACCVRAAVFGAIADVSSVRSVVSEGLAAARAAHAPLRALRLRVALVDALLRAGKTAEAAPLVARLRRVNRSRLPKIVERQIERSVRGRADERDGGSCGAGWSTTPVPGDRSAMAETVVEVLDACQSSDGEADALKRVTAILRARLGAVSVACYGWDRDAMLTLATDGAKARADDVARRAIDASLAIAPTSTTSGLEAASPIRFAGACLGAFGCRWAADEPPDWPAAGAVLAAASAAAAPCVRAEIDRRAVRLESPDGSPWELVGVSGAVATLRHEVARAARAPFNVVIEGESGAGKELVARAVHRLGPRRHAPFCALNCAALTDELVEAELFGHARGAFTGAVAERKGLFEEADGGVLMLDEVADLSARAQAKLLRVIQDGEVRRVGENLTRRVDLRIVAATNRPLAAAVEAGSFRRDLRYRLEVIRIVVPPLRARPDDIPVLAAHFWRQCTDRMQSRSTLAPDTLAALARYDWPGNVRELQNVMAALAAAAGSRGRVGPSLLPAVIAGQTSSGAAQRLDEARRTFDARFVRAALARAGGRRAQAASDLGLTRQGLAKLMARLAIE